jgi:hypothetical protein
MEQWSAVDAHENMEAWRLRMEPWRVSRPVVGSQIRITLVGMRIWNRIRMKIWTGGSALQ